MTLVPAASETVADLAARAPEGELIYAVGDVHGEAELLASLLKAITADAQDRPEQSKRLIMLGDLIDRGPGSREVVDMVMAVNPNLFQVTAMMGNHEAVMLEFLQDPSRGPSWVRYGGAATLRTYGVDLPPSSSDRDWPAIADALAAGLPAAHLAFYKAMPRRLELGDYLFCHAGVRPGVPLAQQSDEDLIWIREDFLLDPGPLEKVVVHGHTPNTKLVSDYRRIGLDTGAYATGVLSAVRLTGTQRAFFQTRRGRGGV